MPALDQFHEAVRNALIKDGWTITAEPLTIETGADRLFIDVAAERLIVAERGPCRIAVEVKSFLGQSRLADLETAIGQYVLYRLALRRKDPERILYLAVPDVVLRNFFQKRQLWRDILTEEGAMILGYNAEGEEITQWIPDPASWIL